MAGGVPLYVRDVLAYYRDLEPLEPSSVPHSVLEQLRRACELCEEAQEVITQTQIRTHFNDVDDGLPEQWLLQYVHVSTRSCVDQQPQPLTLRRCVCSFLMSALKFTQMPVPRPTRDQWKVYDLRYVRMLPDRTLQPLCPAVFRGISRAMMEIALETERQDASALVQCLEKAIEKGVLSASAAGYAKEQIFLTTLAQKKRVSLTAIPYPPHGRRSLLFSFERVQLIWGFDIRIAAVEKYDEYGAVVLFIPRKSNEAFIDAAIYDYTAKTIYAIQVRARLRNG